MKKLMLSLALVCAVAASQVAAAQEKPAENKTEISHAKVEKKTTQKAMKSAKKTTMAKKSGKAKKAGMKSVKKDTTK